MEVTFAGVRNRTIFAARPTSRPHTTDVTDFETDIKRWRERLSMPLKYDSIKTRPPCSTMIPSV